MKDQAILRIAEATCEVLSGVPWHVECNYLAPSYKALLQAARANHPEDPFLSVLSGVGGDAEELNAPQAQILFTQLRIAIESMLPEGAGDAQSQTQAGEPMMAR